jgi:hypothetical protein
MTKCSLRRGPMRNIWELEEKVRSQLVSGVRFEGEPHGDRGPRLVAASVGLSWFVWIKLDEKTNKLTVIYIRGAVMVTVEAVVRDNKDVEIVGVSLSSMCRCGDRGYAHV